MVIHKNNNKGFKKTQWVSSAQMLAGCLLLLLTGASGAIEISTSVALSSSSVVDTITTPDNAHNLALTAVIPSGLSVSAGDISWQIRSLDSSAALQYALGRAPQLSLPAGQYEITLRIGAYQERQIVDVSADKLTTPHFEANIGRLRASSDVAAKWKVAERSAGVAKSAVMNQDARMQISTIVAAGEYDVETTLEHGVSQTQRVNVQAGKVSMAKILIPTGKVRLIATLGNGPAMRPVSWKVYRLDGGKQTVAEPRRHSATLLVSPGHYEAVASLDGLERHRAFTVLTNTSNRIVVAMD